MVFMKLPFGFVAGCVLALAMGCSGDRTGSRQVPATSAPPLAASNGLTPLEYGILKAVLSDFAPEKKDAGYVVVVANSVEMSEYDLRPDEFKRFSDIDEELADLLVYANDPEKRQVLYIFRYCSDIDLQLIRKLATQQSCRLEARPFDQLAVKLIESRDLDAVFSQAASVDDGWKEFYSKYSGAVGMVSVSRPVLSATKKRALVYISWSWHSLAGEDKLVFLSEQDGKWVITDECGLGVS